jgi:hypothetical protein
MPTTAWRSGDHRPVPLNPGSTGNDDLTSKRTQPSASADSTVPPRRAAPRLREAESPPPFANQGLRLRAPQPGRGHAVGDRLLQFQEGHVLVLIEAFAIWHG